MNKLINKRFRVVISITKGDEIGNILSRLGAGTVIGWESQEQAQQAASSFCKDALCIVKHHPFAQFACYGIVCVIDEELNQSTWLQCIGTPSLHDAR